MRRTTRRTSKRANSAIGGRARRRFRLGRRSAAALGVVSAAVLLSAGSAAWATYDYTQAHEGRLLPGATVAGVDVGGLTRQQAVDAVAAAIRPQLDRPISVGWDDRTWTVTPRELGARNDADQAVEAAFRASRETSFFDRMQMKMLGDRLDFERNVAITYPRQGVRGFVKGVAASVDKGARDAAIDYSTGWVEIVPEREGRKVVLKKSRRSLMRALRNGSPEVALTVKPVLPEVTSDAFDQVLLVRIGENKLYLYEHGLIVRSWKVAPGLPEYPTPTGLYRVTEKRYMPTWVNPAPDTWGADMPAEIPPGPDNPLGVRAINWDAPAIRFHGTKATYSLGYNASHGCVRLSNRDVIELYDRIDVGTPIVSTVVAPLKPLYASAPDPILVPEDEGDERPSTDADEGRRAQGD
ncbi:MAG TPA: L,D-transpeptidase/peptidoglycan binding protein [Actinomycetota bacterium]|nr:L,D-transpeptidase/peptidoglycan binding protein [Actinomycetota bacterium]